MAAIKAVQVSARMGEGFTIESKIRDHTLYVDQPKSSGGKDAGPTPLEYLFLSLAGCIASIGRIVATQQKLPVTGMEMEVKGELDTEVLLGKTSAGRAGFTGLTVSVKVHGDMSEADKLKFLHEVDRRCPVSDNLMNTTPVKVELAR